jgi:ribosomal protein L3 glutamine methyltransferase
MSADRIDTLLTLRDWIRWAGSRFNEAGVFYGHGTDNALDEALALVLHALHMEHGIPESYLDCRVTPDEARRIDELLAVRAEQRVPAAYLTGVAHFAGLTFKVNESVLIPRSPIAELIIDGFAPWLDPDRVGRVLDLCAGSGCIGIATAVNLPDADVDLADISSSALDVARENIARHGVADRVRAVRSDVYEGLAGERYDLIVSNPPYVGAAEMDELPTEYQHEPALALEAGDDGMDVVSRILAGAADHLKHGGIIVVEVGASAENLLQRYPGVPFLWLDFERGGDGVFLLTAEQVLSYQHVFQENPQP